jgi:hypothetical protein
MRDAGDSVGSDAVRHSGWAADDSPADGLPYAGPGLLALRLKLTAAARPTRLCRPTPEEMGALFARMPLVGAHDSHAGSYQSIIRKIHVIM